MIKKIKKREGVTLVALIITIIVMLILAGICINIVTDGNFFGKANTANQMNKEQISKAEKDEEDALKQNYEEFKVDEKIEADEIEAYEYVTETIQIDDTEYETKRLKKIEYSLSKYLNDKGGSNGTDIYFKANSNRQNLKYGASVSGTIMKELSNIKSDVEEIKLIDNSSSNIDPNYEQTNTLIKINLTPANLNGLKVWIENTSNEILKAVEYKVDTLTKHIETAYIPTYSTKTDLYAEFDESKVVLELPDKLLSLVDLCEGATISEKTAITTSSIKMKNKNSFAIETYQETTVGNGTETLYIVQEGKKEIEINGQTINGNVVYMDNCSFEFYNPIESVELESPKVLQYATDPVEVKAKYVGANGLTPDVKISDINIIENEELINLKNKVREVENKTVGDENKQNKEKAVQLKNNKFSINSENKIYSDINADNLSALLTVLGKNTFIQDIIKIKIVAFDYGGKKVDVTDNITVAVGNFMIYAINEEMMTKIATSSTPGNIEANGEIYVKDKLGEAIAKANELFNNNNYVIIRQMISTYPVDVYNTANNFEISVKEGKKLIYDINGNSLQFKENSKLVISKGDFTLMSSAKPVTDKYNNKYNENGSMSFYHNTTFTGKVDIKTYSLENFFSIEKYKYLKSLKSFIASLGEETEGLIYIWNCVKYTPLYTTRLMNSYKQYLNSFNNIGLQNKNYRQSMEAVINYGTFNFHSGRIELTTNETVTAIGAFGGGIVINVADSFLKILGEFGIEVPNLTDYAASFAKLENTAVGVKNYSTVVLGTGSGVSEEENPYPEIAIVVDSAVNGIGLSVGSLTNPNRIVSRAYGVWNAGEDKNNDGTISQITEYGTTTMNSGFIQMAITNNTNNWVSLNVGRTYGIFNDWGTTTLNGFTIVPVTRDIYVYGLIMDQILKKKNTETDSEIINAINQVYNNFTNEMDKMINKVQRKHFEGFFSYAELQILYKLTGGGTTCYTNSYAIANAPGRRVFKNEGTGNYNAELGDADGIIFGEGFGLVEKEFEGTIDANIFNSSPVDYKLKVPGYYVLYKDENNNGIYNPAPNGADTDYDYTKNTFQKISNPINHYLKMDTMFGSAFSSGINGINNLINTSWIGEDFVDDNIIYNLIKKTVNGAKNWVDDLITGRNKAYE